MDEYGIIRKVKTVIGPYLSFEFIRIQSNFLLSVPSIYNRMRTFLLEIETGDGMVISMTGYGRSAKESEDYSLTVEIRSVNHRYFDFHIRIPQQFFKLEEKIKKICQKYITRGRVDCFIKIEGNNLVKRSIHIDWELMDEYYQFINNMSERYGIHNDLQISDFLLKPELITIDEHEEINTELENSLIQAVEEAVQNLKEMRITEGKNLHNELQHFLTKIETDIHEVTAFVPEVTKEYEEKLTKKISEFTDAIIDETRVLTEVAILAERSDVTEELTRLRSHVQQFRQSLESTEPIGRKLDFLVQEMNRK